MPNSINWDNVLGEKNESYEEELKDLHRAIDRIAEMFGFSISFDVGFLSFNIHDELNKKATPRRVNEVWNCLAELKSVKRRASK